MTGHQRMRRAIEFDHPDRIPFLRPPEPDAGTVGYGPPAGFVPDEPGRNEWGVLWRSLNPGLGDQGQVAEHPLAEASAIERYTFPDPFAPGRFDAVGPRIDDLRRRGLFVVGTLGKGPMHLLDDLRGFEAYLVDLMSEPDRIDLLLDGIFAFLEGIALQWAEHGADAVIMYDDQAMQSGPLFSMDLWRRHFKPRYASLGRVVHGAGMTWMMHTCGHLGRHLPELVEVGVDVIDNKQPALWMDHPSVDAVRGRVTFSSCLDIQSTMQHITPDDVDTEVRRLVGRLGTPAGGFIVNYYDKPDLALPRDLLDRMIEAFRAL